MSALHFSVERLFFDGGIDVRPSPQVFGLTSLDWVDSTPGTARPGDHLAVVEADDRVLIGDQQPHTLPERSQSGAHKTFSNSSAPSMRRSADGVALEVSFMSCSRQLSKAKVI